MPKKRAKAKIVTQDKAVSGELYRVKGTMHRLRRKPAPGGYDGDAADIPKPD